MTRLEEKLIELGYKPYGKHMYTKDLNKCYILFTIYKKSILDCGLSSIDFIRNKEDLDNIQKAFNQLHKDLKELETCQD